MKNESQLAIFPILLSGLALVASANAAVISAGDKIGIDYGPTTTPNWNNITSNNGGIGVGSVINLSGTVMDGLTITTSNAQFTNNDGTDNWTGLSTNAGSAPVEFVDSVTTDISGNFSLGDGNPFTVVIGGLSAGLTYDLTAVTAAGFSPIDTVAVNGGTPSPISRPDAVANGTFHSFSGLTVNGSGQLVITVVDTGAGQNPILNGVLITATSPAIPEPSATLLGCLGGLLLLRRRRG